jgi:hypothetical protein
MAYIASEDYIAKRIYLHADTATATSLDLINVYLEHIIRRAANANGERRFPRMVLSIGNESAGGEFTPQYVDLQNGVRLVPYNTSHSPLIKPTPLISRAENIAGRDLFDRSSLTSGIEVDIDYRPEISGFREVNTGGLTSAQSAQITAIETAANDIRDFKGLTIGKPATFTPTGISTSTKSVTITGDGKTTSTVTRNA